MSRQLTVTLNAAQMTHSSLLTFRPPTPHDIQRSRIRSHVYSTFHQNEIRLDTVLLPGDLADPTLMLWRGKSSLDGWQKGTAISAWKGMQKSKFPLFGEIHQLMGSLDAGDVVGLVMPPEKY